MNSNNFKNSLNSETVSLNDKFNRAQWKFCPPDLDEEISKDLHMGIQNKVSHALYKLLNWNTRDINYLKSTAKRDAICCMFEELKSRQMDSCPIFCCNPDQHFRDKKCYPIYKVYQELKKIDDNAAKHLLDEEFRNIIIKCVNDEEKLLLQSVPDSFNERSYSIFALPDSLDVKKKIVLVFDFLDLEIFNNEVESLFYTGHANLLENIDQNFTCMLSPTLKLKEEDKWTNFLKAQIDNSHMIIVVFTPAMIEKINYICSTELFEESMNSTSMIDGDHFKYIWATIIRSHKPIVGVVFEDNLMKYNSSLIPAIFHLPQNMKLMLGYLIYLLQTA